MQVLPKNGRHKNKGYSVVAGCPTFAHGPKEKASRDQYRQSNKASSKEPSKGFSISSMINQQLRYQCNDRKTQQHWNVQI